MRKNLADKRGQLNNLAPAILALVFAAVVLVFGIIMSQELTDTPNDVLVNVTNETGGWINTTTYTLDNANACNFNAPVITTAWNATSGAVIGSGNYTVSSAGVVSNASTTAWNSVNFRYTYNWGDEACLSGNATVVGLGTFADFWEIIVLAIVITIVIGLLLIVFGGRKER